MEVNTFGIPPFTRDSSSFSISSRGATGNEEWFTSSSFDSLLKNRIAELELIIQKKDREIDELKDQIDTANIIKEAFLKGVKDGPS